jgi:type IV pilus assembly protein PilB
MAGQFRLGELLVQQGLVTEAQLTRALARQKVQGDRVTLGQIFVSQQILTQQQLDAVLDMFGKRPQLGDVLLRHGTITREQLDHARAVQKKTHAALGKTLIELRYVDDAAVRQALAMQLDIPYVDLDRMSVDRSLSKIINATYARRHSVVPVALSGQMLTICMDDPTQRRLVDDLARATEKVVTVVTASHESIRRAQLRLYEERPETGGGETLEILSEERSVTKSAYALQSTHTQVDVLVRQLMTAAISRRASDIHLEMLSDQTQIRFRVDGVLAYDAIADFRQYCWWKHESVPIAV